MIDPSSALRQTKAEAAVTRAAATESNTAPTSAEAEQSESLILLCLCRIHPASTIVPPSTIPMTRGVKARELTLAEPGVA